MGWVGIDTPPSPSISRGPTGTREPSGHSESCTVSLLMRIGSLVRGEPLPSPRVGLYLGLGFASETTRRQKSEHSGVPCRECGLCKHGAREPAWYVLVSYISRRSQSSQHRNRRPVNVFTPHRTRRQKLCLGWFCGAERRQKVVRRDRVRGAGAGCIGGASCDVVFTSGMRARHSQRLANSPKFCIPK